MPYHLYILYSVFRDRYYIGHTRDFLQERLRKHNTDHKGYSGHTGDWRIVYTEEYASKELAYSREREIKAWKSRRRVMTLVGSKHPG
ncbi:MAG TPA: GIY-YIG nuclease family protein [Chitinophagaceae bacterium]|jgi:putative endonuclease